MTTQPTIVSAYHDLVRRDIFDIFPEKTGRVLDLGGGIGATSAALKAMGRAERIVVADLVADNAAEGVDRTYGGDLENPDFLDRIIEEEGPFDAVLCLDVLEHLRDPWSIIARLRDGLAPSGVIVASVPNARNIRLVWPLVAHGRWELTGMGIMDRTHLRWFVRDTAIRLMTPKGLVLEEARGKLPVKKAFHRANMLTFGLLRGFLDIQYLIRVRKSA